MATRALKYAALMAICFVCVKKIEHKIKKCLEPPDDWDIQTECIGTEIAAGYLRKKGKSGNTWSKRYIVLDKNKLIYYADQLRKLVKGEIVIAGANAANCTTRADEEKKFYFSIWHPVCGEREFYAKTDARRRQWVTNINTASAHLIVSSNYGVLYKLGGITGSSWQERWCVCAGETLDYFDGPTANQSRGGMPMKGALVRQTTRADQQFCFEVEADALDAKVKKNIFGGTKPNKIYTFAVPTQVECDRWVQVLTAASTIPTAPEEGAAGEVDAELTENPMLAVGGGVGSMFDKPKMWPEQEGLLSKKSKNLLSSWQERFFVLDKASRSLKYYKDQADHVGGAVEEKGKIPIESIMMEKFILQDKKDPAIIIFFAKTPKTRKYELKAASPGVAKEWADALLEWVELCKVKEVKKLSALEKLAAAAAEPVVE